MTPGPGPTPRTAVVTSVQTLCNRPVMTISHVSEGESGARARPPGPTMPAFRICTGVSHPAKDPGRRRAHRVRRSARVRAGRRTRRPVERPSRTRTHVHHRGGGARGHPARPPPAARTGVARAAMPSAVRAAGFASPDRARRAHGRPPRPVDGAVRAAPCAGPWPARCATRVAPPARAQARLRPRMPPVTARPALRVRISANRVVTGAKIGLRASGGKDRDKNFPSEALVTGWYGAATTELPPAAWSADADVGAERRNQVPLSRSIAMSRGQTPRPRHDGPLLTGGGLAQPKRRGGCRADSCGHAATGEPPGIDEASEPRRVALQAGPGAFTSSGRAHEPQRWQARRAETVLAATVGHRHARAAALDGKRKGVKGTLAAFAAAPTVSHCESTDRPLALSYPTPAPGPRCGPGAR